MLRADFMPRSESAALQKRQDQFDSIGVNVTVRFSSRVTLPRWVSRRQFTTLEKDPPMFTRIFASPILVDFRTAGFLPTSQGRFAVTFDFIRKRGALGVV